MQSDELAVVNTRERSRGLTYKLLDIEAIDCFSDKVRDFVCASGNLGAHQFKFNYTARNPNATIDVIHSLNLRDGLIDDFKVEIMR